MPIPAEDGLGRARLALERDGVASPGLLAPDIHASWQRCLAAGLDPCRPPAEADEAPLRVARERHATVRRLALAEMHGLYRQIAGTNFMIAFAAADGTLLDAITDPSFGDTAARASIRPGSLWLERRRGTNALGLVAEIGRPVTVHGPEHFFRDHGGLTCTAAPVFGPDARLAGVLDASSDCRSRQRHTQALVAMAARQIENGLFRERHRGALVVAFHNRGEYLHTLSAGLLALEPGGTVLGANAQARFLLQDLPALPGRHFDALFRTGFNAFIDAGRGRERLALQDRVGSTFVATIEAPRPVDRRPRTRPAPARPAPAPLGFVADDPAVADAVRRVEAAARRQLPILICGPTGTGKERLARHAHRASGRRGAFVPVNCAALPESLIEAELFGHAEGAFTGARRGGAPGLIAEADGGTLFLDEIGDMKPALQAVLLRLFDDWTVRPVGGGRPREVDVLLVAATNVDLEAALAAGRFRADLYWRLNTAEVTLPPLAERRDLAAIARHLLAEIAPEFDPSPAVLAWLGGRPWPGNVRELRAVLTRLSLLEAGLPPEAAGGSSGAGPSAGASSGRGTLRATVRDRVRAAHREAGGNVSATARRLGVSRNTVYRALRGA